MSEELTILIDTREQRPFRFAPDTPTRRACLPVGDYTILGLEDRITIERKSLGDLLGSLTHDRPRFLRELEAMRRFQFAALMVEASWSDILLRRYRAQVHPNAVLGSLLAFALKHDVMPILGGDHETAARLTERLLRLYLRYARDG